MVRDVRARSRREVTCEEERASVGIETPRPWSDHALERSTPLRGSRSSLVTLCGHTRHPDGPMPMAHAAWSRTPTAPLRDVLALLRRHRWGQETFPPAATDPDVVFMPRSPRERFSMAVCPSVGHGQRQAESLWETVSLFVARRRIITHVMA